MFFRSRGRHRALAPAQPATPTPAEPTTPPVAKPVAEPVAEPATTLQPPPEADPRFGRLYKTLVRAMWGPERTPEEPAYDPDLARQLATDVRRVRALSEFAARVSTGVSVQRAQAATVSALCERGLSHDARAFLLGMTPDRATDEQRRIGLGQIFFHAGSFELGWQEFDGIDPATLAELAPVEAATCALRTGHDDAATVIAEAVLDAADGPRAADLTAVVGLAGRFLVSGQEKLAGRLVEHAETLVRSESSEADTGLLRNLRRWTHPAPAPQVPSGAIPVGVLDYYQPDFGRSSRNVGDYVQTLAMLGNLVRFRGTRFTGTEGLGELASMLQGRVRPELELPGGDAQVHLLPVSRDFSTGDQLPPDTWALAFGWHLHSTFAVGHGLPYHPHLNPIFLSFHLSSLAALDEATVAYLRDHGPIGCRDHATVDLLLAAGVEAFFSGCLTTTVDAVLPDPPPEEVRRPRIVAAVDLQPWQLRGIKREYEVLTHIGPEHRVAGLDDGVRTAMALLERYQRTYRRVVTSRLHSYLPATSLGIVVGFKPRKAGDARFDGLLGMKPDAPEFVAMRDRIRGLIAEIWPLVLARAPKNEVYARWRTLTEPLVAQARDRLAAPSAEPRPAYDLPAALDRIRAASHSFGPPAAADATEVIMSSDANFARLLPVTIESMLAHASGPVRLWITERGFSAETREEIAALFPDLAITFLGFDHVDYGEITRMLRHISIATMDRLLVAEALPELDRAVYLDVDTVTLDDVAELARTELRGAPLAARIGTQSAFDQWWKAGDSLTAERAADLRRMVAQRHRFDFRTFNAGVLVLDLARLRADRFAEEFVPLAGKWGFNDQDILNYYTGDGYARLDDRWNTYALHERVAGARIVHYAGAGKPWDPGLVPHGDLWREYAERVAVRRQRLRPLAAG
ncbi:glycosyltransferase [Nocardioides cheoyonin]|uniref:glycosyltransferase n=1 Tax=Nocardioides cheoyonin TaxID=3156615 RepID=UPI0032B5D2A0